MHGKLGLKASRGSGGRGTARTLSCIKSEKDVELMQKGVRLNSGFCFSNTSGGSKFANRINLAAKAGVRSNGTFVSFSSERAPSGVVLLTPEYKYIRACLDEIKLWGPDYYKICDTYLKEGNLLGESWDCGKRRLGVLWKLCYKSNQLHG
ncbi:hypothetical protein QAD02_008723 [Eretmocerus hayati]|uniref:Uncharacterized protein n=1 Tax=Eretmocerus hayati TaxID=131215 RepID=A0ACC2N8N3_9HYME|nr:hypothetical protein QAD02_008723 [Eretmocerus hayati]